MRRILFIGLHPEDFCLNGVVVHIPFIKIVPLESYREADEKIRRIKQYDWIIFTSRYGVKYFFERLSKVAPSLITIPLSLKICAIGKTTARTIEKYGLKVDVVPEDESSVGIIGEFKKICGQKLKILIPRSDLADESLPGELKKLGFDVDAIKIYRNIMPRIKRIDLKNFDGIFFTSPSTVRNFFGVYKYIPSHISVKFIGNTTRKTFYEVFR